MIDPRSRLLLFLLGLRQRQLQERYALLWLLAGLVLTLAPLFSNVLDRIAYALGIEYPPALLLLLAIIGLMLIQLSLALSHNSDQLKVLSQELGLLRQQLDALAQAPDQDAVRRAEDATSPDAPMQEGYD